MGAICAAKNDGRSEETFWFPVETLPKGKVSMPDQQALASADSDSSDCFRNSLERRHNVETYYS